MAVNHEIYLTKKDITKEEWLELIKTISNYISIFNHFKIIITNTQNKLRYFIKTNHLLPPTINNLNSFLLKVTNNIEIPQTNYTLPFIIESGSNAIKIIELFEIKSNSSLEYIEISFYKLSKEKTISSTNLYIRKKSKLIKYHLFFCLSTSILAIDFSKNKRFFYSSAPKYLDISKSIHLLNTDSTVSILKIDTFPYLKDDFYLKQNSYNFDSHSLIIGSSGSGKSKFISSFINNISKNLDMKQKYKIVVIDPHAALEKDIGGLSQVIDFKTDNDSINLFISNKDDLISSTELLLELFKSLIGYQYNSKLERVLRHSIHLLLANQTFNFTNLRKLILELEYRNNLIKRLKYNIPISIIDFFLSDFNDLKTKSYNEAISPIISFIDEMEMLPVFNNQSNLKDIKTTIKDNFITLFSLDRTKLGCIVTKTIAGLIMEQLLTLIQSYTFQEHIIFIVDEVAVIENPILSRFLSEARKYNLSLIVASQYFNQISENLKNSIFANVINYYIFRISRLDAKLLVNNLNMKIPLDDTEERKIKLLTELNHRECIIRVGVNGLILPTMKGRTLDFRSIPRIITNSKTKINSNTNSHTPPKTDFKISSNISLKDILISNSTSRKKVIK